jgi:hypothetical protein
MSEVNYRQRHVFDPIHSGADECECELTADADIHPTNSTTEQPASEPQLSSLHLRLAVCGLSG